jgi:hypothetical protein
MNYATEISFGPIITRKFLFKYKAMKTYGGVKV